MTISLKKVTAGSGYDYLIRQVAAQDSTVRTGLAAYYEEKGEAPGVWMGSGLDGLDGIAAGDPVTEAQMKALFGNGHHPLADQIRQAALDAGLSERDAEKACRLGRPFAVRANGSPEFRQELKRRYAAVNIAAGLPANAKLDPDQLAQIRSEVASEFFAREFGRPPENPLELHRAVAIWSRPVAATIAGVDLTVSPTKSFSTLWALAPLATSQQLEELHRQAVAKVVEYLETQAFSRVGPHGVRNVETRGLVAVAFTHRDSRAGDPDLHTHLVIANKVQSTDGRWYALNTNLIYKAKVAASELYSATLEASLAETFGIRFVERSTGAGKRPVREIDGVDLALAARWSTRRGQIEHRRDELAAAFLADHGRPPTEAEMIALAQRANLETREAKHEPRSLAEQRATWRGQAEQVLGIGGVDGMLATAFNRPAVNPKTPSIDWLIDTSARVIGVLESERSTWQAWHVRAEALRQTRAAGVPAELLDRVVDTIVDLALETRSIRLSIDDPIQEPDALRRSDGQSVYTIPGVDWYTSSRILDAEQRIVANAGRTDGRVVDPSLVDLAQLEALANGTQLTPGQSDLVRDMACSGRRVQLAIAPAGTGKTTAMRVLGTAWTESGGTVIGLAPSAAAAKALADQLEVPCDTLAKLTWSLDHPEQPTPGLAGRHRAGQPGHHRRSRHGRHPQPRPGDRRGDDPRRQRPPHRGRPPAVRDRRRRRPAGHRSRARRLPPHRDPPVRRPGRGRSVHGAAGGAGRGAGLLPRPRPHPRRRHHHHGARGAGRVDAGPRERPGRPHARPDPRPRCQTQPARSAALPRRPAACSVVVPASPTTTSRWPATW